MKKLKIPKSVEIVISELANAGFEAFVVGGSVRDVLLRKEPKDWDVTTKATPKQVLEIFPEGKYENNFGTVLISDKYLSGLKRYADDIEIKQEVKEELIKIAKEKYFNKIKCAGHGELHVENVTKNALEIAKMLKVINLDFIEIISVFHDIGRAEPGKEVHIKKGQRVIEKEFANYFSKKEIEIFKKGIFYDSTAPRECLESQILVEADLIDGVSEERIALMKGKARQEHINWLKTYFNKKGAYKELIFVKSKEIMFKAIEVFNQGSIGFQLPQIQVTQNENIEVTTFRIESTYSDKRHPDEVKFAETLEEDLSRRDFTVNAMAIKQIKNKKKGEISQKNTEADLFEIIDLFEGITDLQNRILRAVGDPLERFDEDALRMIRAVRFAVQLDFEIEEKTKNAIKNKIANMKFVSIERIRDEFEKIILSENPKRGVELLVETGLMEYIIPEIFNTIGVKQNHHHYYGPYNTVYKHLVASLAKCPSEKLEVRLAAFLHDIGKPDVKRGSGEKATFYNHEYAGSRIVWRILERLKFPRKVIEKTTLLVRNHMFYYNVDEVGEAGVRRVVRKVGIQNIKDLIDVRIGDRLGSGVPKAVPYKLRHFQYMVEKVSKDPISVKQLKINGDILIKELEFKPGPQIGAILEILLADAIENPEINTKEQLMVLAKTLKNKDLESLRGIAKNKIKKENKKEEQKTKNKHWVK